MEKNSCGIISTAGHQNKEWRNLYFLPDQIVRLVDLNDEETDFYEAFNSDHQVTEHFHEFAMGLQTDEQGNFYYAKSARHARPQLVPHHGTLIMRVTADGSSSEALAHGFRAITESAAIRMVPL